MFDRLENITNSDTCDNLFLLYERYFKTSSDNSRLAKPLQKYIYYVTKIIQMLLANEMTLQWS